MTDVPLASAIRQADARMELGPPAYVVLGMVGLGARSGYEIKRAVELSIRFVWKISPVQIYPSLERLERAGLIQGRAAPRGKGPRRFYDITEDGKNALCEWLTREEPMPCEMRDIGIVKLFFADALDREDAAVLLAAVKRRSEEGVAMLRELEPTSRLVEEQGNAYPLLTLRMGIAIAQAMLDVCQEFEQTFSGRRHHSP